jgi:hypothetical protein
MMCLTFKNMSVEKMKNDFTWPKFKHLFFRTLGLFVLVGFLSSCISTKEQDQREGGRGVGPVSDVYPYAFEEVEQAIRHAMGRYPIATDSVESGIFDTEFIKGPARFRAPHRVGIPHPLGYQYRLLVRYVRGKVDDRNVVKVQITKVNQIKRDFFVEPEAIESDGYEEDAILYRVHRELSIKRAIKRINEKENEKNRKT